ncbi:MAG: aspartate/glutamate racemase family protein [Alphaproteobacteria bacterium]|nr:aspartate/glutamate racemase family protein [Alphaproteobacteria bacterium]
MIGVFDSGHGGLTVLRALTATLPDERFLYLGDHAYAPYGMRSNEEIYQLTRRRIADLFDRGCNLVVLACNTASAVALRRLQTEWLPSVAPEKRILGVFVPVVEALTAQDWYVRGPSPYAPPRAARTVGVFATRRTVESRSFPNEIKARAPSMSVIQQPCPRLAEAIEEGLNEDALKRGVERYAGQLLAKAGRTQIDLVVLGCTHFPLVGDYFRGALPKEIRVMDQPDVVAQSLVSYLSRHPEFRRDPSEAPGLTLLTSGDPETVSTIAARFYGAEVSFHHLSGATAAKPAAVGESEVS